VSVESLTVTEVEPVSSRYLASIVACPGVCAPRRPQLPELVDTAITEGALLDHFTSEVRSACEPSLKKPVAVVLPAVPAAYWTRSGTTTRRWSAALLTTMVAVPRSCCPANAMVPTSSPCPGPSAWTSPSVTGELLTEMTSADDGSTLHDTRSVTSPPSGTGGPPCEVSVATAWVLPPAGRMDGSAESARMALMRSPG